MKKIFYLFICLGLNFPLFAQGDNIEVKEVTLEEEEKMAADDDFDMYRFISGSNQSRLYTFTDMDNKIKGSPYLTEEFVSGDLITTEGNTMTGLTFKYNIYQDCIEYQKDNKAINLYANAIQGFKIGAGKEAREFRNGFPYFTEQTTNLTYYEVLHDGPTKLLCRYYRDVGQSQGTMNIPGMNNEIKSYKFSDIKKSYILLIDGKFHPIKLNKKSVAKAFNSGTMIAYMKRKKNKAKSVEDVAKLAEEYDRYQAKEKAKN